MQTSREQRDGASRKAVTASRGARRTHNDELLQMMFPPNSVAQHFKDHPLDGRDIISAVPAAPHIVGRREPVPLPTQPIGMPDKPKPKTDTVPSIAAAAQEAAARLGADALVNPPGMTLGLPGETTKDPDYGSVLDEVLERPPNTFL